MKTILFAAVLIGIGGIATTSDAQRPRRIERDYPVVVIGHKHPKYDHHGSARRAPVRRPAPPKHYSSRRVLEEKQDLRQIRDISRAWHHAVRRGDRYERSMADRRLEAWLWNELRSHHRRGYGSYHAKRVRELSRQVDALDWRFEHGRATRYDYDRKARILDELVVASELQVRRAKARSNGGRYRSFAAR